MAGLDWTAGLDPLVAASLLAASFAGSFLTVALGLGGGILLLAMMASLMPPAALIPVHGVIQLGSNGMRAALFRRHMHWPVFGAFALGTAVGIGLGGAVAVQLPPALVQIGVGGFILWSLPGRPPRWLARWPWLTGGVASFLTMFFGATGPFVASYVRALGLSREGHTATHAMFMTLQHGLKVVAFVGLGFAYGPWMAFLAAMIVAGALGTLAGRQVLLKMSDRLFRRALTLVLALLALRLIWQGGAGLAATGYL